MIDNCNYTFDVVKHKKSGKLFYHICQCYFYEDIDEIKNYNYILPHTSEIYDLAMSRNLFPQFKDYVVVGYSPDTESEFKNTFELHQYVRVPETHNKNSITLSKDELDKLYSLLSDKPMYYSICSKISEALKELNKMNERSIKDAEYYNSLSLDDQNDEDYYDSLAYTR